MGVVNAYVDTDTTNKSPRQRPEEVGFGELNVLTKTFEVQAADDDGSIYRLAPIPTNFVPVEILIACDAITNGTDYDLGFYRTAEEGGAVVKKDLLMDGQTMASASKVLNGMGIVGIENYGKTIAELLGAASVNAPNGQPYSNVNTPPVLDLALTANTVGTVQGTISVIAKFAVNG